MPEGAGVKPGVETLSAAGTTVATPERTVAGRLRWLLRTHESLGSPIPRRHRHPVSLRTSVIANHRPAKILGTSSLILLVHGYHYGVEDEAIYLPAVKHILNPALYPHDARFFTAQTGLTAFPRSMAILSRFCHLSVHATFFLAYCISIVAFVSVLRSVAERLFPEERSRWAAVLLPSALWTMPVAGTALFIMDQHLHPRNLATIALLFALLAMLDGKTASVTLWVGLAAAFHPLMAFYGTSFLAMFGRRGFTLQFAGLCLGIPLGCYILPDVTPTWRQATQSYYYLSSWHMYEWLGIIGPLVILWERARAVRCRAPVMSRMSASLVRFGLLYFMVSMLFSYVPRLARLAALQPMRSLQLIYLLLSCFAGGMVMQRFPRQYPVLLILFLGLCGGMYYAQVQEFPATPHVEWPGLKASNEWLAAFDWIRRSTPPAAYFVMDPRYLESPDEDFHGFRAFAERSALADEIADKSVASLFPSLAEEWRTETDPLRDWSRFDSSAIRDLKTRFGVDWVLIQRGHSPRFADLVCPYENSGIRVCRID
jgi:hypothetical protein